MLWDNHEVCTFCHYKWEISEYFLISQPWLGVSVPSAPTLLIKETCWFLPSSGDWCWWCSSSSVRGGCFMASFCTSEHCAGHCGAKQLLVTTNTRSGTMTHVSAGDGRTWHTGWSWRECLRARQYSYSGWGAPLGWSRGHVRAEALSGPITIYVRQCPELYITRGRVFMVRSGDNGAVCTRIQFPRSARNYRDTFRDIE